MEKHTDYQKYEIKKYEAIKWKVVWSWVGMRTFLQKCSRTPNSYTTTLQWNASPEEK